LIILLKKTICEGNHTMAKYKAKDKVLIELDEIDANNLNVLDLAEITISQILKHIPHEEVMTQKYKAGDKLTLEITLSEGNALYYNNVSFSENTKIISHIPAPEPKKFEQWQNVYGYGCSNYVYFDLDKARNRRVMYGYKYTIHSVIYPDDASKNIFETVVL